MSRTSTRPGLLALGSALFAAATLLSLPALAGKPAPKPPAENPCDEAGEGTTFGARANSVFLDSNVLGIDVDLGPVPDTGELPTTGGDAAATLATIDGVPLPIELPSAVSLSAAVLHNTTMGSGDTSTALSTVLDLGLGVQGVLGVDADVLTATATRKCIGSPLAATTDASLTGANIAGLGISILGSPLDLSGLPSSVPANYSLLDQLPSAIPALLDPLVSGSIILNEQFVAGGRQIVNALHVKLKVLDVLGGLTTTLDLVVSHAEAGVTCGTGTNPNSCNCKVKDFYTGGGQIAVPNGKASFSVNGSASDSVGPKGHLNLVNHTTRQHIKGTPLKLYAGDDVAPTTDRFLTFTCADNQGSPSGNCTAHVNDTAESGGGKDSFGLDFGSYDYEYGLMSRGNLQLHLPKCGTTTTTTKPRGRR